MYINVRIYVKFLIKKPSSNGSLQNHGLCSWNLEQRASSKSALYLEISVCIEFIVFSTWAIKSSTFSHPAHGSRPVCSISEKTVLKDFVTFKSIFEVNTLIDKWCFPSAIMSLRVDKEFFGRACLHKRDALVDWRLESLSLAKPFFSSLVVAKRFSISFWWASFTISFSSRSNFSMWFFTSVFFLSLFVLCTILLFAVGNKL